MKPATTFANFTIIVAEHFSGEFSFNNNKIKIKINKNKIK